MTRAHLTARTCHTESSPHGLEGRGSILLNIASGIALVGLPFYAVYAATKSGIAQFGESLRRELIGTGVHVATVYPGATDTAMMTSQNAGAELGWARRSLEAGKHEIKTAPEDRRAMQQLNITDPLAVDAALAPASRPSNSRCATTAASESQSPTCGSISIKDSGCSAFPALRQGGKPLTAGAPT